MRLLVSDLLKEGEREGKTREGGKAGRREEIKSCFRFGLGVSSHGYVSESGPESYGTVQLWEASARALGCDRGSREVILVPDFQGLWWEE